MQRLGTYRLFWTYCLSLIIGLTAVTSVYGRGDCACAPTAASIFEAPKAPSSCCKLPGAPDKAEPACETPPATELQGCCCDTHPRWLALSHTVDASTVEKGAVPAPDLGWASWPTGTLAHSTGAAAPDWVAAPPPLRPYTPPLRYKDVPVFVQSFLL